MIAAISLLYGVNNANLLLSNNNFVNSAVYPSAISAESEDTIELTPCGFKSPCASRLISYTAFSLRLLTSDELVLPPVALRI